MCLTLTIHLTLNHIVTLKSRLGSFSVIGNDTIWQIAREFISALHVALSCVVRFQDKARCWWKIANFRIKRFHTGENSLYYRTSREHGLYGSTNCCISQCPVHYPVNLMQISLSSPELLTFFYSHTLKIQDGSGRCIGFSGYVNVVIPACW